MSSSATHIVNAAVIAFDDDGEATGFQWVMLEPGNPLAASDSSDDLSPFYSDEFPVLSREQWEKKS